MSCDQEEKIYTYAEWSQAEQSVIDIHVAQCSFCAEARNQMMLQQKWVRQLANSKPLPAHSAALTQKIMSKVEKQRSGHESWRLNLNLPWVRYSSITFSAILLFCFLAEIASTPELPRKQVVMQGPMLDTSLFLRNQMESLKNEKPQKLSERFSYFKSDQYSLKNI